MRRIKDPNETESLGTQSRVRQSPTASPLLTPSIASVTSVTSDSLQGANIVGGDRSNRRNLQGPLLAGTHTTLPLNGFITAHNSNNIQTPQSLYDNQNRTYLTIPSYLMMSTSGNSSSSSSFQPNSSVSLQSSNNDFASRSINNEHRLVANQSPQPDINSLTSRSRSRDEVSFSSPPVSPVMKRGRPHQQKNIMSLAERKEREAANRRRAIYNELGKNARKENDAMVYLDGPRIYTCGECRTHLTSHDEIISKSFHGRHGRAYLFDQCVNVNTGPAEDRRLITGLHSVCDISCKRCKTVIGWTYAKAYEQSQKYKEGKFIIEKIHLHMEESDCYQVNLPAGEKRDRWRIRSMSWSSDHSINASPRSRGSHTIYEYGPRSSSLTSPKLRSDSVNTEGASVSTIGSPPMLPTFARPQSPPIL